MMSEFPRTSIEDLSVSRLMIGINWFLGFSHTSKAKDMHLVETMTASRIADIVEVFINGGVDTLFGMMAIPKLVQGIEEAEQRTGKKCITIANPDLPLDDSPDGKGKTERQLDELADLGVAICLPHPNTTDTFVNRADKSLEGMARYLTLIRERGMIPGLSTHMPETPIYADASGLDVATYVQIYNAAGFLMHYEIDWVHRIIWNAKKPVITIKPLAAGRLSPFVGLAFSWNTIRDIDMVCIGTCSPYEAEEVIELSLSIFEKRIANVDLQKTKSKESVAKGEQ
jgi:hypothetical protein